MSRRRLLGIGLLSVVGFVAGCGGEQTHEVKISSSEKGSPGRLGRLKEKKEEISAKKQQKKR